MPIVRLPQATHCKTRPLSEPPSSIWHKNNFSVHRKLKKAILNPDVLNLAKFEESSRLGGGQFAPATRFDDPAGLEHVNEIRSTNGRQAMADNYGGYQAVNPFDGVQHPSLVFGIQ